MQDARKVIRLHKMLQESDGILSYDSIRFSHEFQENDGETLRRLFSKLHAKHKTTLSALYIVLYKNSDNDFYKSIILDEQSAKEMVNTGSVVDIHYFALFNTKQYKDISLAVELVPRIMLGYLDSVKLEHAKYITRGVLADASRSLKRINVSADDTVNQANDMARNVSNEKQSRVGKQKAKSPRSAKSKSNAKR